MPPRVPFSRLLLSAAVGGLCLVLTNRAPAAPLEVAPPPHMIAGDVDRALIAEVKARSELMTNLEYLSDRIGGRLTGSASLEKANKWAAEKMKGYGLENVRLEPWEIPYGWERGPASMKLVEPDTGRTLLIASRGWTPGTKGKITGDVVLVKNPRTTDDLKPYKGKLKGAVVLLAEPTKVAPVTDLNYGPAAGAKKGEKRERPPSDAFVKELMGFLKAEGVACQVTDAGKPHGLLVTTGGWGADRAAAEEGFPRVFMAHEHYALLHRLATRTAVTAITCAPWIRFGPFALSNVSLCVWCVSRYSSMSWRHANPGTPAPSNGRWSVPPMPPVSSPFHPSTAFSESSCGSSTGTMFFRPCVPNPSTFPVPVSWTSATECFGIWSLYFSTYRREPYSPCSSPVNRQNRMVRFGRCPCFASAATARAVSSTTQLPVPLSVVPLPSSHESRCAPTTTTSSGFSPPRTSPTVL